MEYIRKFDNEHEYNLLMENPEENQKITNYDTKVFYFEEEEKMVIGSGKRDIELSLEKLNKENIHVYKASVVSTSDDNVSCSIYYKTLPKGEKNVNIATIVGKIGYVIDEDNSEVYMLLENATVPTKLTKDRDWKYNFADGVLTISRVIEGNITINFKSISEESLLENRFTIINIAKNGGSPQVLYNNGTINDELINLTSGDEYTITGTCISGGTIQIGIVSGINLCTVEGNVLKPSGYKNQGGEIIVSVSSNVYRGYKSVTENIQFNVSLEVAKVLNWDEIVPPTNGVYNWTAGNQLDLRSLRVSNGCQFFIETTERIQTTEIDRVYNVIGNGSESVAQVKIRIIGNELFLGTTVTKNLNIKLKTNNLYWKNVYYNSQVYSEFNNSTLRFTQLQEINAGSVVRLNVNEEADNASNIKYTVTPQTFGILVGNEYHPSLPDGNKRTIEIKGEIPVHENYRGAIIRSYFDIVPVIFNVSDWMDNSNTFYGGELFNLNYNRTTPAIYDTTAVTAYYSIIENPSNLFVIENNDDKLKLGSMNGSELDLNGTEREVKVKVTINPGGNYKKLEVERTIQCKLRPVVFYFIESKVIYRNTDMTFTMKFDDGTKITNSDISQYYYNQFFSPGKQYSNNIQIRVDSVDREETITEFNKISTPYTGGNYSFNYINSSISNGGGFKFNMTKPNPEQWVKYIYIRLYIPPRGNFDGFDKVTKFTFINPS